MLIMHASSYGPGTSGAVFVYAAAPGISALELCAETPSDWVKQGMYTMLLCRHDARTCQGPY